MRAAPSFPAPSPRSFLGLPGSVESHTCTDVHVFSTVALHCVAAVLKLGAHFNHLRALLSPEKL